MNKPSKQTHYTGPVLALVAVVGVGALAFAALKPRPIAAELGHVSRGPMELAVREDGRTRVKERYTVSAPLAATLARQTLSPGDRVEQGDVIATLLPLPPALLDQRSRAQAQAQVAAAAANERRARATIARAEASLKFAREQAERSAKLHRSAGTSDVELDRTKTALRTAEQDLNSARFGARVAAYEVRMANAVVGRLTNKGEEGQLELRAPVAGTILKVLAESEGVVQPGTPLLELGDTSHLEVVAEVLTVDAVHIQGGTPARIVRWGGEADLQAQVRSKEPSAFTTRSALGVEEQRVNVVLEFEGPAERWRDLGDGYRVEAEIQIWRTPETLRVPASAVFRDEEGWAVFTLSDGVVSHTPIKAGRHGPDFVQVLEGLQDRQVVVLFPSDQVADGRLVEPR